MSTTTATNNAATVAKLYEAFGRGDIAFILEHLDDNCVWVGTGEGLIPSGGTYKGRDALNFFKRLGETVDFTAFNPQSISNINDHEVVAFGNMSATARATGKAASSDWAMHWKFNAEGKVVYYHDFHDTAAAYISYQP